MKIIIAGASAIGSHLARLLSRSNQDIILIDDNAEKLNAISSDYDLMTLRAAPNDIMALKDAGVEDTDLFIAVTRDENININCCVIAHAMGARKTVAQIDHYDYIRPEYEAIIHKMGIDTLIYPEMLAARDIINGLKMSWVRQRWDVLSGTLVMLGIKLRESCEILNQPLKHLCGPKDPYHIVAIKRGEETIIPGGDDELMIYDIAYFMTMKNYIPFIRKIVGKEHYVDVKNVMIMGGGKTAVRAALTLPEYMNAKLIEIDEHRCEYLNEVIDNDHVMMINGDGRDQSLLIDENIGNTQAFVALTGNAETNILACLTAKRMGVRKTIAMVESTNYANMAESLDIGTIINKKVLAAGNIYQMMLDADVQNIRFLMSVNADVAEFTAQRGSKVTRKKVAELGLPRGITIGGLVRGKTGMLVSGGTQIEAGDNVVVFCHNVNMKNIEKFFT